MAIHDDYARLTPYELLLPDPGFPDERFSSIGDEALERGVDTGNPAAFVMLGAVQGILADLREEDVDPKSAHDHASVLYFTYHMWLAGPSVVLVQGSTMRGLMAETSPETSPADNSGEAAEGAGEPTDEAWTAALLERAGYVQMPQHLVWLEEGDAGGSGDPPSPEPAEPHPAEPAGGEASPPESVDGFFWSADRGGILNLALVTGVRPDRPGYGIVPVPAQPLSALPAWAAGPAREGGGDFTTSLPGAELDGLLGLRTPAEVFKLAALLLHRLTREHAPASGQTAAPPPPGGQPAPTVPPPSALPWTAL